MDLSDDADDRGIGRSFSTESRSPVPDLTSRARSLAILREIFGETVGDDVLDDTLDVARIPAHEGTRSADEDVAVRGPTTEIAGSELPATNEDADTNSTEADLPGLSEEESLRYRRQMYRTDI